jgi:hypothetical protein
MKLIFFLFLCLNSFVVFGQNDSGPDNYVEENKTTEDAYDDERINTEADELPVPCECPEIDVQAQEAQSTVNALFPQNSIFLISPYTEPSPPANQEREVIPGYVEKLPKGYSDSSYKQIPQD